MKKVYRWILALVLLSFVIAGIFLALAPEQIPVHYNASGQIDRWGSKYEYLVMPVLTAVFAGFMVWVAGYERKKDRESNERVVAGMTVWVLILFNVLWLFFMVNAVKIAQTDGAAQELSVRGMMILLMASFIPLGNRMPKAQRNSFLGLRTKWSMADDVCWQKSQRLGGITMVAAGALGVALVSVLPMDWGLCVVVALLLIMTAVDVAGTYLIWKRQQNK